MTNSLSLGPSQPNTLGRARCGQQRSPRRSGTMALGALAAMAIALAPAAVAPQVASADPICTTSGARTICTFSFTGAAQTWTVPAGVTQATFDVFGAQGGRIAGIN